MARLALVLLCLLSVARAQTATTAKPPAKKKVAAKPKAAPARTSRRVVTRPSARTPAKPPVRASTRTPARKPAPVRGRRASAAPVRSLVQGQPVPERYKEIQQALASKGYYQGEISGQWGPDSIDSLKRFQAEQNLTADGKLNSLSLIALGLGPKRTLTAQAAPLRQAPSLPPQTPEIHP